MGLQILFENLEAPDSQLFLKWHLLFLPP